MTVNLGTTPFEVRSGVFGDTQAPFNPLGVKQMSGGKVRLTLTKDFKTQEWRSAGILGPIIEPGKTYSLEILGRLDVFDPRVCFAVWGNGPNGEADFIEVCRWGARLQENIYTAASHKDGVATPAGRFVGRALDLHRVTITTMANGCVATVRGFEPTEPLLDFWPVLAQFTLPYFPGMRLKIALWVPKTGPLYSAVRDRGPLTIDVRGFTIT